MSDGTKVEWTDATWNPISGCSRVSEGCANCYIDRTPPFRIDARHFVDASGERSHAIGSTTGVQLHPDRLTRPLTWRKPRRIFVNSLSDLFHAAIPDDYIAQVFAVMALAPQHTFQVLTKRPGRMRSLLSSESFKDAVLVQIALVAADRTMGWPPPQGFAWPIPNVWLGVSVENQKWADVRIPLLMETPAAIRFLSCEPLLGQINLTRWLSPQQSQQFSGAVSFDDHVRHDSGKQGGDVCGSGDRPVAHRLPPMLLDSGVVPADNTANGRLKPVDDLRRGAVDIDADATPAISDSPDVQSSLAVDHAGDVSQYSRIGRHGDALDGALPSLSADLGVGRSQPSPDGPASNLEPSSDLVDGLSGQVGIGGLLRGDRGGVHKEHSPTLDWLVAGGESGPNARRMNPAWARQLRYECTTSGIAFLFKQAGTILAREWGLRGKGADPAEWPEEFPREWPHG